jgi:hypothetical protein
VVAKVPIADYTQYAARGQMLVAVAKHLAGDLVANMMVLMKGRITEN